MDAASMKLVGEALLITALIVSTFYGLYRGLNSIVESVGRMTIVQSEEPMSCICGICGTSLALTGMFFISVLVIFFI